MLRTRTTRRLRTKAERTLLGLFMSVVVLALERGLTRRRERPPS